MNVIHNAEFITGNPDWNPVCPSFKKSIVLKEDVKKATLEITALGIYTCKINGIRVGDAYMTPGYTNYKNRLQYQSYDVTPLMKESSDIVVGVGPGWFASRFMGAMNANGGIYNGAHYGTVPALRCALKIDYVSGESETVCSDSSWLCAKSEVLSSQIYDGEIIDARILPDYCENARITEYKTKLVPFDGDLVRATERVAVKEIIKTPNGETVIDFGQNIAGFVEFTINNAVGGESVSFLHGEVLDKDGNFYRDNYRGAKAQVIYTAKSGKQTYGANYTFYGFRYIKIENWCEDIKPENFTAVVIHSDMERTGYFECGHKKLSRLYENIVWGQRGNFIDIPTDCPQRDERAGWTGDATVFYRTASINYDTSKFFKKWLREVKGEFFKLGYVPFCVPNVHVTPGGCCSVWGDIAAIGPWEHYMASEDKDFLKEMFPMMKKWVDYLYSFEGEAYISKLGGFGDWLAIDAPYGSYQGATHKPIISTAFYYYSTGLLVKAGKVLGKDVAKYEQMLSKIKDAFNKNFYKGGKLTGDTQTAYVLAIHFGLVDGERKDKCAKRLVYLIKKANMALTTGFAGTPYLLLALSDIGRDDIAYSLLLREKFPGWLFSVNMGATTIWEHWDGINEEGKMWSTAMNSFNHYAYGSCGAWMYHYILGIKRYDDAPAYKHFEISPVPSKKLGYASGRIKTKYGEIASAWKYEGDTVRYTFEIPKGTTATVKIGGCTEELSAGQYTRYSKG